MIRARRLIAASVLLSLSSVLAGCGGGGISSFDPMDLLDFMDTKKKLPGDRKPVFPEGVPGLEQGVPKDLYKGANQQAVDPAQQQAAVPPAPEPVEKKPARRAAKPRAAQAPAAAPAAEPDGEAEAAPPPPKPKRQRAAAPAAQPAEPAAAPAQQSQSAFPAPLPSGSFSR
jgi:hypothetical protein